MAVRIDEIGAANGFSKAVWVKTEVLLLHTTSARYKIYSDCSFEVESTMRAQEFSIGQLAAQTGSKVQTIRYYEQIGLMPEPLRTAGNQRRYGRQHMARLAFIRHSRELGFPLDAIRELLNLADVPDRSCVAADRIAKGQLEQVDRRIRQLTALRAEFKRMIAQCRGGKICECRIIEVLADSSHAHCLNDRHDAS